MLVSLKIKLFFMAKNTSILLGDYFENYINQKITSGKYNSVSEVVRTALRLLESEENKSKTLINELIVGEKSGFIDDFDRNENLNRIHSKFVDK
jgi:antitoxin ParD1/3/4